ncbi:hypothetical protein PR001_g13438 [Phytophthora rubi]|uniref:Uncharacterized protein n=1 Tax=Phytophthora rubi TaxID=129364 RepID=A0A6A3LNN1_9STRA|nr:hypothetical protein PR001_g13438 [Phytophthora rubi]
MFIKNPDLEERSRAANVEYLRRLLKRNRLTIRRITHKGLKKRSDMEVYFPTQYNL